MVLLFYNKHTQLVLLHSKLCSLCKASPEHSSPAPRERRQVMGCPTWLQIYGWGNGLKIWQQGKIHSQGCYGKRLAGKPANQSWSREGEAKRSISWVKRHSRLKSGREAKWEWKSHAPCFFKEERFQCCHIVAVAYGWMRPSTKFEWHGMSFLQAWDYLGFNGKVWSL